jgi:hypothetical protein
VTGVVHDPGSYREAMEAAARVVDFAEFRAMRVLVSVSPWLNGSKPGGASLCIGVIRLRGVTPPPRPIGRCRCIGRRIVRDRSGIIRSSQRPGDGPTDDRWCPPTTASPTAAATMTLRLRYTGGANQDSRAQSDDSFFIVVMSQYNVNICLYLVAARKNFLLFKSVSEAVSGEILSKKANIVGSDLDAALPNLYRQGRCHSKLTEGRRSPVPGRPNRRLPWRSRVCCDPVTFKSV